MEAGSASYCVLPAPLLRYGAQRGTRHNVKNNRTEDQPDGAKQPGESMVNRTVGQIIELIRTQDLRPGDPLPAENALANRVGVSRIVVREANRSLSALGIVEIAVGRAPRVSVPDEHVVGMLLEHVVHTRHVTIQQVLDVRRSLEVRAAALAALRRSDQEAEKLMQHAAAMRAAYDDLEVMREHDVAIHAIVADAAHNPLLTIMIKAFAPLLREMWPVGWKSRAEEGERDSMLRCHEAIAETIFKQDVAGARHAMSAHFDDTMRVLMNAGVT